MEYHLIPPFFIIEPQNSFDKAWEEFCRQLLNLAHQTTEVRRRTPPEFGIDLLWPQEGLAFQCKCVEAGEAGTFKTDDAIQSLQRALEMQSVMKWQKYILCININLTGKQELKLQEKLPTIDFYTNGYWVDLCKKFHNQIADRFRIPVPISRIYIDQTLDKIYLRHYTQQYQRDPSAPLMSILVYSKRRHQIFELEIPVNFTAGELLLLLSELFHLPEPITTYPERDISLSLKYTLAINDHEIRPERVLSDFTTDQSRPLILLWKIVTYYRQGFHTDVQDLEHVKQRNTWTEVTDAPLPEPVKEVAERFVREIDQLFSAAIELWRSC